MNSVFTLHITIQDVSMLVGRTSKVRSLHHNKENGSYKRTFGKACFFKFNGTITFNNKYDEIFYLQLI